MLSRFDTMHDCVRLTDTVCTDPDRACMQYVAQNMLCCVCRCQAINNLLITDDNEKLIVEVGGPQRYVALLGPDYDESVQTEAARGLFMLAFHLDENTIKETRCVDGRYVHLITSITALSSMTERTECIQTNIGLVWCSGPVGRVSDL